VKNGLKSALGKIEGSIKITRALICVAFKLPSALIRHYYDDINISINSGLYLIEKEKYVNMKA
jgi:hypothetical protein